MKIKEIQLMQFGRFNDWKLVLPDKPFIVLHGPNEAGKSTLRQMMLSVLFQFPKKNVLDLYLRHRDPSISKGVLLLEMENGRLLHAERQVADKKLNLRTDQGETLDHTLLTNNFGGIDRSLYETVFCFGLEGWQALDDLGPADINEWLFNASMPGASSIIKLEQNLQKKCEELFKPSGRKPKMNVLLNELDQSRTALKKWEQNLDNYEALQDRLKQNRRELSFCEEAYDVFEEKKTMFSLFHSVQPILSDFIVIKEELDGLGEIKPFPEQGLERLERLVTQKLTIQNQFTEVENRLQEWDQRLNELQNETQNESVFEQTVYPLINQKPQYEATCVDINKLHDKINQLDAKQQMALNKLGEEWSLASINATSTGIDVENILIDLEEKRQELEKKETTLEHDLERRHKELKTKEEQLGELKDALLSETEREKIEKYAKAHQSSYKSETAVLQKNVLINQAMSEQRLKRISLAIGLFLLLLSGVGAFVLSTAMSSSFSIGLLVIGSIISFIIMGIPFFIFRNINTKEMLKKLEQASEREREEALSMSSSTKDAAYQLEQDDRLYLQIEIEEKQIRLEKKGYEATVVEFDRIQLKKDTLDQGFSNWKSEHSFHTKTPLRWMPNVYHLVIDLKDLIYEHQQLTEELKRLKEDKDQFEKAVRAVCKALNFPMQNYAALEKAFNNYRKLSLELKQKQEQREQIQEDRDKLYRQLEAFEKALTDLFIYADADDEEEFRIRAAQVMKQAQLRDKLMGLRAQLKKVVSDEAFIKKSFQWMKDGTWQEESPERIKEEERQLKGNKERLEKERLEITSELKALEKDDTFRDLRYRFESQQSELNDYAKEWMVYQTSLALLQETKDSYRKEKLPFIIKQAGNYFSMMTDGAYKTVTVGENGVFTAVSASGTAFYMKELSKGTHEQLYLAIRLALADAMSPEETLPIIIDDGLVNTDQARHERIMQLLKEVSLSRQILLLTCHPERFQTIDSDSLLSIVNP